MMHLLDPLIFGAAPLPGPPAFVSSVADSNPTSPIESNNVVFAETGRYLLGLFVQGPTNSVLVAVRVNGSPASLVVRETTANVSSLVGIFEFVVSNPGTYPVEVEWQAGSNMVCFSLGVMYVGGLSVVGTDETNVAPSVLSINTSAGDVFFGIAASDAGTATYVATNATEHYEHVLDISRTATGASNLACTGGSPEDFTFTPTGATGQTLAVGVICR